jgi:uncharacterized protein YjlB
MQPAVKQSAPPITHLFADDGAIPNNPLPLLLYRGAIDLSGSADPERVIETPPTDPVFGAAGPLMMLWRA